MHSRTIAVVVLACLGASSAALAQSWTQFRGPGSQGRSDARNLPITWSETQNVAWKTAIHGKAWSSPVVLGKQVWVTTATPDGRQLSVLCVDLDTGKILRDLKLFDVEAPQYAHPFNSYASPTPVIEPGRIYVTFGSPGTACLDTETGKVLWQRRDFVCNHFRGAGSSPLLYGDLLIMNFDGSDNQFVVALDKKTGQTVWKTNRSVDFKDLDENGKPEADGDWRKAFSTPVITEFGGKPVLLSVGSKAIYGYEPLTGQELWRIEDYNAHSGSVTPIHGHGMVFYCTGHARGDLVALRPGSNGKPEVAWRVRRNVPTRSSPLLVDDLIYLVDDGGIASCVEAKTGKDVWPQRGRLRGDFSAAPLYADGRIYYFSEHGFATAVEPGRQFKVLGESQMEEGFMASAAPIDGSLILRTKTHLYRVSGTR